MNKNNKTLTSLLPVVLACAVPCAADAQVPTDGEGLYDIACASCHGDAGRGVPRDRIAFDVPVPDLTDCSFSSREPDADWITVAMHGGPVRGFDETMPAFGEALSEEQLQLVMDHIRTFCGDDRWPRGELNLPRALVTEKAYPEDEVVTAILVESKNGIINNESFQSNDTKTSKRVSASRISQGVSGLSSAWRTTESLF